MGRLFAGNLILINSVLEDIKVIVCMLVSHQVLFPCSCGVATSISYGGTKYLRNRAQNEQYKRQHAYWALKPRTQGRPTGVGCLPRHRGEQCMCKRVTMKQDEIESTLLILKS